MPCPKEKKEQQSKPIIQYDLLDIKIKEYASITSAAIENNITLQGISMCCRGVIKTYKKYKWRFKNE